MDGGGSMQSTEERGAEKLMDDHLKSIGLHRKKIAKDGSCLFRAVAEQVLHCQSLHTEVRAKCVEFLKQNRAVYEAFIEGDFEDYLYKLQDPQQWVGEVEINALAVMYKRDFLIFQEPGKPAVNITDNNFKDKVRLCFLNGNHYDSVYPIDHIKSAAMCQSILYELLYDGVFRVERGLLSHCHRASRPTDVLSDDSMPACCSSDDSDVDGGEALWVENETSTAATRHNRGRGRGRPLPHRVRRSLNPTLLRNIEYDVWHKTKRAQQKLDYCIAAGMQFTVGDRCQVRPEGSGRSYNATIKEVSPNNGPVTVYIEELGRKQVPLWSVRPPNNESSWSTVANRDKRLSNGHGDWEERGGRGRGRGKHAPASSSVSQATAPGPSGRVQKQNSWTSQTSTEEQGGVKANRKSTSSLESTFGLTEEERLAREEEERNVALVEIQLRDEHSFPALGTQAGSQADGGKKKGGEKKRLQRNKAKSPVEDVGAPSPPAGDGPKSSTPPPAPSAAATNTTRQSSHASAAKPHAVALPNMAAANTAAAASSTPLTCAAPTTKTSAPSRASAASPPPADASAPGGAVSPSVPSSASLISLKPPVLPAASSPLTPHTTSSSSAKLRPSSASPSPSSPLPPPTFIAPIAPSPAAAAAAAQSFLPPSTLPRSSSPLPSLRHSPSPPSFSSSSPPLVDRPAPVHEAPAQTSGSSPNTGGAPHICPQESLPPNQSQVSVVSVSQTQTPALLRHSENQTHPPQPPNQVPKPLMQMEAQACVPHPQHQPQSPPQTQISHPQSQSPLPAQGASYPYTSATHPQPHIPPPPPSLSVSTSQTHPSLQSQNQTPPPPAQPHPQPVTSPAHPPPLNPASLPGAVPLQQLSQLYQDPLYPGFPQGEKGDIAPTPPLSSSKSGDDLPRDVNVLRFFFNLGVKAYSMPMFPPYIYLLPLQQAHTMHPKLPPRSPSPSPTPHYPPPNPPIRHQEAYPHPQYPPSSASMPPQFDRPSPLAEPPHPSDASFNQAGYPVTQPPPHRMSCPSPSWQQHQMPPPRNPSFPVGYPAASSPYTVPTALSQGYHPGQSPGHPLYPAGVPPYPPTSLGYQSSSAHEELQMSQEVMEQRHPVNGDTMAGQGPGRVPGPAAAAAKAANANNNRTVALPGFGHKKEAPESLSRTVLLVDPPLNNTPILVSNPSVKDAPVSMRTMKPSSTSGSHDIISKAMTAGDHKPPRSYDPRGHQNPPHPANTFVPLGAAEPGRPGYLATAERLSVGCSTEDNWEEQLGFKQATPNHRGMRRNPRGAGSGGGRGRGTYRRRHGEAVPGAGAGYGYIQYNSSYKGRGRDTGF